MRKGKKDPDPHLWLMDPDPDPGDPKTCGSCGSGSGSGSRSPTLVGRVDFVCQWLRQKGVFCTKHKQGQMQFSHLSSFLHLESIKQFIEDQAFLGSLHLSEHLTILIRYNTIWLLAPPPPSPNQFVSLSQPSCASPVELADGDGGGGGEEPKHMNARKPGPL